MDLQIKYSSSAYSWLCFRHAVQEAMRSENIETEITSLKDSFWIIPICDLCAMEKSDKENARIEWYEKYRKDK